MSLVAISFVHGGILGGLALAGLPIIIHILNRRRFKTLEWAAMDFLLKAAVRNRRRVRLENLLLLALRTLLVICLVLLVARPFTERQDALAALFGSAGTTERVILLDDSHSMRAGQGNRAAFDSAKQLIKRLVTRLHDERSSDRVTIVLGSRPRQGEEGFARVAVASAQYRKMLQSIDRLRVSDGAFGLVDAVAAISEMFQEKEARVVLHVVSDFRRRDWAEADGSLQRDVSEALRRFTERGEVRFLDVGSPPVQNVGVIDLKPVDRAVIAGVPATFVATVKNHGPDPVANLSVWFEFGDNVTLPVKIETTLEPGGRTAQVKREFTFRAAGPAIVKARTQTDALSGDDVRRRVVNVRRDMRFLLVDGEPEQEDYRGETDFLAAALMPPGRVDSGIGVEVVSEHEFSGRELDAYDGVFLCNVYRLPDDRVKRLEEYVHGGGGLVFFLGDQVDPNVYNSTFFGRGEEVGKKLLPLLLRDTEGSSESYVNLAAPALDHPVVRFLRGLNQIVFRTVAVNRYVLGETTARGAARVILSYTDENSSPFLAEKSFGEGRVLLFTTAADLEWSNFPHSILYLALLQEAARYVVKPDAASTTLTVGAPIVIRYDPKRIAPQVSVVPPAELGGAPIRLMSTKERGQLFYRFERPLVAGTYTVRLKTPQGEDFVRPYVFNVDPTEGDLRRADLEGIRKAVPGSRIERAGDEAALFETDASDRTEFWRTLAYILVAFAALETLLAWRFGHHAARKLVQAEGKQVFVR
ncbi:MAG: BatA domain-containing protein [Planctomycetota bacterium]|jgi:hypothetical protein